MDPEYFNNPDNTEIYTLKSEIQDLKIKLEATNKVITAARTHTRAGKQRKERAAAFQKAASIARNGGPKGPAAIKEVEQKHPTVIDIGDAVNDIEEALEYYDKVNR